MTRFALVPEATEGSSYLVRDVFMGDRSRWGLREVVGGERNHCGLQEVVVGYRKSLTEDRRHYGLQNVVVGDTTLGYKRIRCG